jgi:hypothetical protein
MKFQSENELVQRSGSDEFLLDHLEPSQNPRVLDLCCGVNDDGRVQIPSSVMIFVMDTRIPSLVYYQNQIGFESRSALVKRLESDLTKVSGGHILIVL